MASVSTSFPQSEAEYEQAIRALVPCWSEGRSADEALAVCDQALAAHPRCARFHVMRGMLLQLVDDAGPDVPLEESIRCYEAALALDPQCEDAWFELGMFRDVVMAKPRKARQFLHKAFLLRRARERSGAAR